MKKIYIIIFIILLPNFHAYSAFLNITIDYKKNTKCKLDKQILKNEIYNYTEFTADQIKENKDK